MRHALLFAALPLSLSIAGCSGGGGGGGDDGPPPTLSGAVLFVPDSTPLTLLASAPSVDAATSRQPLAPGRGLRLQSELSAGRGVVRLRTSERVAVQVRLRGAPQARVAHLEPLSMAVGAAGREARFLARGPFDLIVRGEESAFGLEVAARAITGPVALEGQLGAFAAGDTLELDAAAGGRAQLSCAESLDLVIESSGPLSVLDSQGREVARSQGGSLRVEAAPLASFVLRAEAGQTRPIALRAEPAAQARVCATVASAEEERAAFGLPFSAELATAVAHEFVPGELLIRALPGRDLGDEIASRSGRLTQRIPETSDLVEVALPEQLDDAGRARTTLAAIASFEVSGDVEWAEPNRIRRILADVGSGGGPVTPNDPFYALQWHYDLIKLPQAWSIATGDPSVIVAVLDTGSRPHPDLDANTIAGFDFVSSIASAGDGDGFDNDPTDVGDGNGLTPSSFHGTHVAGTIGAVSDNGSGVAGVNWSCSLMHLRVLGKQGGTDADIAQAVRYAARLANGSGTLPLQRAHVINMSLGGPGSTSTMQSAVTAARNAGVVVLAAAGNNNSGQAFFPASYNGVLSVSAVDLNAQKAPYSNFGPRVDIAAPGGNTGVDLNGDGFSDGVLSTLVDENNGHSPQFVFYQGTSMACPHAAGLAALMFDVNPALTVAQVEDILQSTAIDLGAPGRDDIFGHGLIQADLALAAALGGGAPNPLMAISPSELNFGAATTQLSVLITNAGGGVLDVGTPVFTPTTIGFTATLQTVPGGATTDVSAVTVTVNRAGLADGTYTGTLSIPSNGGNIDVPVAMSVETPAAPEDVDLFLLLVDANSFETVAQALLNPTTTLAWEFLDDGFGGAIPAGDYLLVCGSDDDGDLFILEPEDTYSGAWPTLNEIELLELSRGDELTDLDFVVSATQSTLSGAAHPRLPRGGFRLLGGRGGR